MKKQPKIKVESVILKIGRRKITLSLEDAKELQHQLNSALGSEKYSVPTWPWPITYSGASSSNSILCSGTSAFIDVNFKKDDEDPEAVTA